MSLLTDTQAALDALADDASDDVVAAVLASLVTNRPISTTSTTITSSSSGEMFGTPPDQNPVRLQAAAGFGFETVRI